MTGLLPRLIADGIDPFTVDLPVTGFPATAFQPAQTRRPLSDEFLTTIAREYLARGRGYAASLATECVVSPRTVVSWIGKARARGLLSAPPVRGAAGGQLTRTAPPWPTSWSVDLRAAHRCTSTMRCRIPVCRLLRVHSMGLTRRSSKDALQAALIRERSREIHHRRTSLLEALEDAETLTARDLAKPSPSRSPNYAKPATTPGSGSSPT